MNIKLEKFICNDDIRNEVTDPNLFRKYKPKHRDGSIAFNENGIFSDKIFGRIGKCRCGSLTMPGYCEECNTRVIDGRDFPDYYIKFDYFRFPYIGTTYPNKEIEELLTYKSFIYRGEIFNFELLNIDITDFNQEEIIYGPNAVASILGQEWVNENTTNKLSIPHPIFRRVIEQEDGFYVSPINKHYIELLQKKKALTKFIDDTSSQFEILAICQEMYEIITDIQNKVMDILAKNNRCEVDLELKGQSITGTIRAVIVNGYGLDEDTVVIGKSFLKTLYPELYSKYYNNGNINIDTVNYELQDKKILLNRQPTIGMKSYLCMKPVFSKRDDERFTVKLPPVNTNGLAGDYDGDVLNILALYTEVANEEAQELLPSKNYLDESNGSIRAGLPKEFQYVLSRIKGDLL